MDGETLMTVLGAVAVSLSLLLAVFLLLADGPLKAANRFLAAFLVLTAIDLLGWTAPLFPETARTLLVFRLPLSWLQMPVLFAYAAALCGGRARGHLVGGALAAIAAAAALLPRALGTLPEGWREGATDLAFIDAGLHLQFYIYIALLVVVLARYRHDYRRDRSNPDDVTSRWLATLIAVSVVAHTLVLAKNLALFGGRADAFPALQIAVGLTAVAITCALTLAALVRQDLFLGAPAEPPAAVPPGPAPVRPSTPEDEQAMARLALFMAGQEPFLDPSLTVRTLARRLGMGQRELSSLINERMGVHFFDFVNRHRIDKAAALLTDPATRDLGVLEIAHLSGFNTKSSFNAAFRKHRGETPTAHRQRMRTMNRASA